MGQACCKPGVKGGDEIAVDHKNVPRTISTSDDDEEAWWDASEELTLESVIEEWQIEQHGSLGTLQAEVPVAVNNAPTCFTTKFICCSDQRDMIVITIFHRLK